MACVGNFVRKLEYVMQGIVQRQGENMNIRLAYSKHVKI